MAKSIIVIGATGLQGGSVVRTLLGDDSYTLTAITRNAQSDAAKKLSTDGVRVVEADLDDIASLEAAFKGSYAIFAVTNFFEPFATKSEAEAMAIETRQGINVAKAAAATPTLKHYIWSTLPNTHQVTNGKVSVPHYMAKSKVDDYIKTDHALFNKTTFLRVAFYATNFHYPFYKPFSVPTAGRETYIQLLASPPSVAFQVVGDVTVDVGLFVQSILGQPDKTLPGKIVICSTDHLTAGEMLSTWASAQGKEAKYVQVDKATYYSMWPKWGEVMDRMHMFLEMAEGNGFAGNDVVLTKDDLGVVGLVNTADAFAKMST